MIIGICDDENCIREQVAMVCKEVAEKYNTDIQIETYSDGKQVIEEELDILILDIEMDIPLTDGVPFEELLTTLK